MSSQDAPGWAAIEARFHEIYGSSEASHWGHFGTPAYLDASEPPEYPLDGVSVWRGDDFWHYVGFGMSELYVKETNDPTTSGFGYEPVLRVQASSPEEAPPTWPVQLLQKLSQAQWGRPRFAPGHNMTTGPISPGSETEGFLMVEDPVLGVLDTAHGSVQMLLFVGVSRAALTQAVGGKARELTGGFKGQDLRTTL